MVKKAAVVDLLLTVNSLAEPEPKEAEQAAGLKMHKHSDELVKILKGYLVYRCSGCKMARVKPV